MMGPDVVRDTAGGAGGPGDGVAFPKLGEGVGIGNGCTARGVGVGVPMDWPRTGAIPWGTLGANRGAATGVGAVEETEIGLPAVEATKIGLLVIDATKME